MSILFWVARSSRVLATMSRRRELFFEFQILPESNTSRKVCFGETPAPGGQAVRYPEIGAQRAPLQLIERALKIFRQRRFEKFPLAGTRMSEAKFPGVQHLAWIIPGQLCAIDFVSQNWMTEMMKMDADLMGAAAV